MNRLLFVLLSLTLFLHSCQNTSTQANIEDDIKAYFKEKGLDKRTTYFDVSLENGKLVGEAQNQELIDDFVSWVNQDRKPALENGIEPIGTRTAYIRNSVGNARSNPKHSAELATQYLMGQKVNILDETDEWYYIQGPDNYLAWIDKGGVLTEEKTSEGWLNGEKQMVIVNEYDARDINDKSRVITDLVFGNVLAKKSVEGKIVYLTPDGSMLAIDGSMLRSGDEILYKTNVELALEKAHSLMGRPYLWGGTSTKGVDCSGFTRTAFMNAGYMLGRDASLQVHEGKEVNKDDISQWQAGDLLFFGSLREDGSQRITHVAIHKENGDFIHSSQRVRIESLNPESPIYNKDRAASLMRVKRIF